MSTTIDTSNGTIKSIDHSETRAMRDEASTLQGEARAAAHALIPQGESVGSRASREALEKRLFGKAPLPPTAKASDKAMDAAEARYRADCDDLGLPPDHDGIETVRRAAADRLELSAEKRGARHALGMTGLRYLRSPRQ